MKAVYPRWRGEHFHWQHQGDCRTGLSPLARGTPAVAFLCLRPVRFIPAGAGNTTGLRKGGDKPPVYPRWRGEHLTIRKNPVLPAGLSPLARGTRRRRICGRYRGRFIPAGAGNTRICGRYRGPTSVYPRWRGEHATITPQNVMSGGLSPLARGTPGDKTNDVSKARFIPAGAGNTAWREHHPRAMAVYPRWRGEHSS